MTQQEIVNTLYKDGWEVSPTKWYVYRKIIRNEVWFCCIGSIPSNEPECFVAYIYKKSEDGKNYYTHEQLTEKLKEINHQTIT